MAAHPSSTWASFPDPIGQSGCPSDHVTLQLPLTRTVHRMGPRVSRAAQMLRDLDLDPDQVLVCTPEQGLDGEREEMKAQKHMLRDAVPFKLALERKHRTLVHQFMTQELRVTFPNN